MSARGRVIDLIASEVLIVVVSGGTWMIEQSLAIWVFLGLNAVVFALDRGRG